MRRVLHGDLVQLGRVLSVQPRDIRAAVCAQAFAEAAEAAEHRRRTGRWHPRFGDGSLAGWAMRHPRPPEPPLDDPDYADSLMLILARLRDS